MLLGHASHRTGDDQVACPPDRCAGIHHPVPDLAPSGTRRLSLAGQVRRPFLVDGARCYRIRHGKRLRLLRPRAFGDQRRFHLRAEA